MSINNTSERRAGPFDTDGTSFTAPFDFKVFSEEDLVVTQSEDGVETELVLDIDYTVSLNADQEADAGGSITLTAAPDGPTITITSNMPAIQPVVLASSGGFYPRVVSDALDRATILIQQLAEKLSRALLAPFDTTEIEGMYPVVLPDGTYGFSSGTGADAGLRADLADTRGADNIGNKSPITNTIIRNSGDRFDERLTLKDFHANAGNGNTTHDSYALAQYCDAMQQEGGAVLLNGDQFFNGDTGTGVLYRKISATLPPGDYKVTGGFGADLSMLALRADPQTTTIEIMEDEFLFEIPNYLFLTYLFGLSVAGGKGMLRHTFTGENVSNDHIVEQCQIHDYDVAGISSDANNMPYWRIRLNKFYCNPDAVGLVKGLSLGGLLDNSYIDDNSFLRNRIHMHLADIKSGSVQVRNNDLFSFTPHFTTADMWLGGSEDAGQFNTNVGQGFRIIGNKFGGENLDQAPVAPEVDQKAPRILIAAAEYGINPGNRALSTPDRTWKNGDDGRHWLQSLIIAENYMNTVSSVDGIGPDADLMEIWLEKVGFKYHDNVHAGGMFNWLFHHMDTRQASKDNINSDIRIQRSAGEPAPYRYGVSNEFMGFIDEVGASSDRHARLPRGFADPAAASILAVADADASFTVEGTTAKTAVSYRGGGNTAIEVEFATAAEGVLVQIPDLDVYIGQTAWLTVDMDGSAATTGPLLFILTADKVADVDPITLVSALVPPPADGWRPVTFELYVPTNVDTAGGTLYIRAPLTDGTDVCTIGHVRLNAGLSPMALP